MDRTPGATSTAALTIDIAALFEAFVRIALREALPATPTQFPTGSGTSRLALYSGHIGLEPDLSYWNRGHCTFIGDMKYKRDIRVGHNDDLYQLLAYATAARLRSAMLVHADGPPNPSPTTCQPPVCTSTSAT